MNADYSEFAVATRPMVREAIILAGGLGTRLRSTVPDLPKCMAPVAGKPFLSYLIEYLADQGVERFIFALGYKSDAIEDFLWGEFAGGSTGELGRPGATPGLSYKLSIEKEPLGTGGAIRLACEQAQEDTLLVLNGDTFFGIDTLELATFHSQKQAACTLCLKPMQNFDRYGVVEAGPDGRVIRFLEKQFYKEGLINGGVYALNVPSFLEQPLPAKFSFEKDWLEPSYSDRPLYGLVQDGYFIDIGIPADYERAQRESEKLR